jgi:hypothetical protein
MSHKLVAVNSVRKEGMSHSVWPGQGGRGRGATAYIVFGQGTGTMFVHMLDSAVRAELTKCLMGMLRQVGVN